MLKNKETDKSHTPDHSACHIVIDVIHGLAFLQREGRVRE